ncbi:hypothetical protein [Flavobacterium degerlachei]|jgi:hypothetical protein|uniref:Uncharacterized protein n=1 Tax=Flavobacterium degerlachei TaxID=229203 RepID=A0A1H2ULM5_9FLAO|nr:hypothetical protein [Flavobacterium degerlachei]SDW56980.1 hypothetical protein SAMN05444338_103202 [Flavobacterium degerlachei]
MNLQKNRIEEIKANGYQLDFASVFNLAFENYKKIALYAGSMILVFFFIIFALIATFTIAFIGIAALKTMANPESLETQMATESFKLIYTGFEILFSCLISPLLAGLIKMAYCAERDEEFHVSSIFEYYKAPYFKELFIAVLLISSVTSGLMLALDYAGVVLLGSLINLAVSFFTLLTIPLIIFADLKAVDAISSSFTIILKQPLVILGLVFVAGMASMVGFIGCCIGIFFTIPFMYSMYYALYSEIVGFDKENEFQKVENSQY